MFFNMFRYFFCNIILKNDKKVLSLYRQKDIINHLYNLKFFHIRITHEVLTRESRDLIISLERRY